MTAAGLKNIDCSKPYYLLANSNSLKIRAITKDQNLVRLALTGSLENNDTQKSETVGVVHITVTNNAVGPITPIASTTPVTIVSTTTKTTAPNVSNYLPTYNPTYYGKADLAVRVLQVGLLNTATNLISTQTTFSSYDTVGIKFEIRNDGDAATGPWYFSATLPSLTNPNYTSPTQVSLQPGQSIQFTLGFNNLTNSYSNLITINADPVNAVTENNKANNVATSPVINNGYNNNYNNYNYNNNGCYINGVFTYNCYNNNYNYNNNGLTVSCYASPSNPSSGDRVRWYANASGGDGSYDYSWSGTDGLDSTAHNPYITYDNDGVKYATVSVSSNGYTAIQTCSVNVGNYYNNNYGNTDLSVRVLNVGTLNTYGQFVPTNSISRGQTPVVQIQVTNNGNTDSGLWNYTATLNPAYPNYTYQGYNQASLGAGQSTILTLAFNSNNGYTNYYSGTNTFYINIDPNNMVNDYNRSNNSTSAGINIY